MAQEEAAHLWVPVGITRADADPVIWHSCSCGAVRVGNHEWTGRYDRESGAGIHLIQWSDEGGGDPHCVLGALVRNALRAFTESREVNRP